MKPFPIDRLIWRERNRRRQYPQIPPPKGLRLVYYALAPDRMKYNIAHGTTEDMECFYKEHPDWDMKWSPDLDEIHPTALEVKFEDFRGKLEDALGWASVVCFFPIYLCIWVCFRVKF